MTRHATPFIVVAMQVVAAPDKFRGTATAADIASAIGHACWEAGHDCAEVPMADGGEGTLDALGGANRTSRVRDPLGRTVTAEWRLQDKTAVIEMARASGLALVGGAERNEPLAASTTGTGELIDAALNLGAKRIIVCLGGSATTDGGLGAVRAIHSPAQLKQVDLVIACDVTTRFTEAAVEFGPQKGATPSQVKFLTNRLEGTARLYEEQFGIDVTSIPGAGAAGGLAGGLLALGGRIVSGFDHVAEEVELGEQVAGADLVVTGEGFVDTNSFEGKVVGGVCALAERQGKQVLIVCGDYDDTLELPAHARIVSIRRIFGEAEAMSQTRTCVERAVAEALRA